MCLTEVCARTSLPWIFRNHVASHHVGTPSFMMLFQHCRGATIQLLHELGKLEIFDKQTLFIGLWECYYLYARTMIYLVHSS